MKKQKIDTILHTLSFFYLCLLTWIILLKMSAPFEIFELVGTRSVNLIPFRGLFLGHFDFIEFWGNIILFIPFGLYISFYLKKSSFWEKLLFTTGLSITYEFLQFIFAIGVTDITDLILNSMGGVIGIAIYKFCTIFFKELEVKKWLVICSIALGTPMAAFLIMRVPFY